MTKPLIIRKRKHVHFNSAINVTEINTHRDYTIQERTSIWYTGDEYSNFKRFKKIRMLLDNDVGVGVGVGVCRRGERIDGSLWRWTSLAGLNWQLSPRTLVSALSRSPTFDLKSKFLCFLFVDFWYFSQKLII
jgi:hypothetical protein